MWKCEQCGEEIEDQFEACWKCTQPEREPAETMPEHSQPATATAPVTPPPPEWQLKYRVFRGEWTTWDDLFVEAADFATRTGRNRVLSISHSEDRSDGVVTVWYWAHAGDGPVQ